MYLAVASWLGSFARSPQITGSNTAVARCPDKFMHENFSLQNMSSVWTMKSKVLKISFISTNLSSAENHQKKSFEIFFESDKNLIKSDFISTKTSQKNNERSSRWIKVISWTIFWYFLNNSSFNTFPPPAFVCVTILLLTTTTSAATFVRFKVLTKCSEKREKKQEKTCNFFAGPFPVEKKIGQTFGTIFSIFALICLLTRVTRCRIKKLPNFFQ